MFNRCEWECNEGDLGDVGGDVGGDEGGAETT